MSDWTGRWIPLTCEDVWGLRKGRLFGVYSLQVRGPTRVMANSVPKTKFGQLPALYRSDNSESLGHHPCASGA